jgi:hypothetical protein
MGQSRWLGSVVLLRPADRSGDLLITGGVTAGSNGDFRECDIIIVLRVITSNFEILDS